MQKITKMNLTTPELITLRTKINSIFKKQINNAIRAIKAN